VSHGALLDAFVRASAARRAPSGRGGARNGPGSSWTEVMGRIGAPHSGMDVERLEGGQGG